MRTSFVVLMLIAGLVSGCTNYRRVKTEYYENGTKKFEEVEDGYKPSDNKTFTFLKISPL